MPTGTTVKFSFFGPDKTGEGLEHLAIKLTLTPDISITIFPIILHTFRRFFPGE